MQLLPDPTDTLSTLLDDIRTRRRSCEEATQLCLDHIDRRDPEIHAWAVLDRQGALEQARQRDADLLSGVWRGPLHGIPVGVKDIIDVKGLPTACGANQYAQGPAPDDAPIVASLRSAGAVILGKTVTTPYAWIDPPPTRNPWALDRTPGGSSSGSAAAVSAGMAYAALGSQTGGSITRPCAYCGVSGLKPTHRRLSSQGILPVAPSLDHPGPIARTARDLALVWHALSGSQSPIAPCNQPPGLARLLGAFHDAADPSARESLTLAASVLSHAGASVTETPLPFDFDNVRLQHRVLMASEAAAKHEGRYARIPEDYPPQISRLIDEGLAFHASAYIHALNHQKALKQSILRLFDHADALITPSALGAAPDRSTTGDPIFNSPWSYTGLPTVAIPLALSDEGLPLSLQLVGPPNSEDRLLSIAIWCEDTLTVARSA
jgi:aspartyl-tRNA(Asn)/glutamyl-tRNA(Gln) amidotransferase subunit A